MMRLFLRATIIALIGGFVLGVTYRTLIGLFWSVAYLPLGYVFDTVLASVCALAGALTVRLILVFVPIGQLSNRLVVTPIWIFAALISLVLCYSWVKNPGAPAWVLSTQLILGALAFGTTQLFVAHRFPFSPFDKTADQEARLASHER